MFQKQLALKLLRGSGSHNDNTGGDLKLPSFNEERDDLDAFLCRFERACQAYNVRPDEYSMQLAKLLQGKSLEVYQRLSEAEISDYEALKMNLLKRFNLTEGGYRKKFKNSKMEIGETPQQFVERLRRYLDKWRDMAGCESSQEGLETLILRDQFFTLVIKISGLSSRKGESCH